MLMVMGPGSTPIVLYLRQGRYSWQWCRLRVSDGKVLGVLEGKHSYFDMTGTKNIFFTPQPNEKTASSHRRHRNRSQWRHPHPKLLWKVVKSATGKLVQV